jgi:hypothetical protein
MCSLGLLLAKLTSVSSLPFAGTTTLCLGFCVWVFYLVASCVRFGPGPFKLIGFLCILCCLFQGLVFLVFKSDKICGDFTGCSLGVGGKCGISATVFWFLAGLFSCAAGKKKDDDVPEAAPNDKAQDDAQDDEAQDDKAQDETAAEE